MSINDADRETHTSLQLLLPWYVNGSLGAGEHERVAEHLARCPECAAELANQRAVAECIRASTVDSMAGQLAYSRLQSRLRSGRPGTEAARGLRAVGRLAPWFATAAALATVAVLMADRGIPHEPGFSVVPPANYRTLADPASVTRPNTLRVVFAKDTQRQRIEAIAASVGAHIMDGPSQHGVFTLGLPDSGSEPGPLAHALDALRANDAVVFVEPATRLDNPVAGSARR